jgi:hypothetical protein
MEPFMKTLCSVMALAITLAIGGAWSSGAEAQSSKQTTARKAATTQQKPAPRRTKAVAKAPAQKPCVRHTWFGCVGWDPDPNVRDMLSREVGDDDS